MLNTLEKSQQEGLGACGWEGWAGWGSEKRVDMEASVWVSQAWVGHQGLRLAAGTAPCLPSPLLW